MIAINKKIVCVYKDQPITLNRMIKNPTIGFMKHIQTFVKL